MILYLQVAVLHRAHQPDYAPQEQQENVSSTEGGYVWPGPQSHVFFPPGLGGARQPLLEVHEQRVCALGSFCATGAQHVYLHPDSLKLRAHGMNVPVFFCKVKFINKRVSSLTELLI